jgi:hypothetical protein
VTDWRTMPWAVSATDMAVEETRELIRQTAEALELLEGRCWKREDPKPRLLCGWSVDDRKDGRETSLAVMVDTLNEAFVTIGMFVGIAASNRMVYVNCDVRIVEHVHDRPVELVRFISELYSAAIASEDRVAATKEVVTRRGGMDAGSALAMFEMAERHGMDPSRPVRIERWGSSPLSPSSTRVVGSMKSHTDVSADETPGRVRITAHPNGGLTLKPEMRVVHSDGFDAMEILHMHRTASEGKTA